MHLLAVLVDANHGMLHRWAKQMVDAFLVVITWKNSVFPVILPAMNLVPPAISGVEPNISYVSLRKR